MHARLGEDGVDDVGEVVDGRADRIGAGEKADWALAVFDQDVCW